MTYYVCNSKKCGGNQPALGFSDQAKMANQKCMRCNAKGPWTPGTAPVATPLAFDLQNMTVAAAMGQFVIDSHQVKHYGTGATKYARFTGLDWREVHQLIAYGARRLITLQKSQGHSTPNDGFVIITGRRDSWPTGDTTREPSTIIKIQMGAPGGAFSGHGYPVEELVVARNSGDRVTIANNAWQAEVLSDTNDSIRHGG